MTAKPIKKTLAVAASLALAGSLACDDPFASFIQPIPETPTQVTLWDFRTGPFHQPSAFDIVGARPARVDQTIAWDFIFYLRQDGVAELRPFSAVVDDDTDAGLQRVTTTFEGLQRAPAGGYERGTPLQISEGDVVAAVSRRDPGSAALCRRFGKLEVLEIDAQAATVTFRHLINPNCEMRGLIPGERGDV